MQLTTPIHSLFYGLTLPLRALKLIILHPILLFWSLLPIGITLAVSRLMIGALMNFVKQHLFQLLTHAGISPSSWGAWILLAVTQVLVFLLAAFSFSFIAGIIASPFNDFLAENTERFSTPPLLPPLHKNTFRYRVHLLRIDVAKTAAAGLATFLALIFSWVPVLNFAVMWTAFMLIAFQFISYPQTRRGLGFLEGLRFLLRNHFACLGFGISFAFLFAIPLVSSLALPLAVIGGTLLVARAA